MINIVFYFPDGHTEVEPEVHPRSQHEAIPIPKGAEAFAVYLATEPAETPRLQIEGTVPGPVYPITSWVGPGKPSDEAWEHVPWGYGDQDEATEPDDRG